MNYPSDTRSYLYFNEEGNLRCKPRTITTNNFSTFDDSQIKLTAGKYAIHIGIQANVDEQFYNAIDESTEYFTESPFYISVSIGESVQKYQLAQYTPIHIHMMKVIELADTTVLSIQSNYDKYTQVNIETIVEKL